MGNRYRRARQFLTYLMLSLFVSGCFEARIQSLGGQVAGGGTGKPEVNNLLIIDPAADQKLYALANNSVRGNCQTAGGDVLIAFAPTGKATTVGVKATCLADSSFSAIANLLTTPAGTYTVTVEQTSLAGTRFSSTTQFTLLANTAATPKPGTPSAAMVSLSHSLLPDVTLLASGATVNVGTTTVSGARPIVKIRLRNLGNTTVSLTKVLPAGFALTGLPASLVSGASVDLPFSLATGLPAGTKSGAYSVTAMSGTISATAKLTLTAIVKADAVAPAPSPTPTPGPNPTGCARVAGVAVGSEIVFGPACKEFISGIGNGPFEDANEYNLYRATNVEGLRYWLTIAANPYPADPTNWYHIKTESARLAKKLLFAKQNGMKITLTLSYDKTNGFYQPDVKLRQQGMKRIILDMVDEMNKVFATGNLTFDQVVTDLNIGNEVGSTGYWPVADNLRAPIHYLRDMYGPAKAAMLERNLRNVRVTAASVWCPDTYPGRADALLDQIMDDVRMAADPSKDVGGKPTVLEAAGTTYPDGKRATVPLEFSRDSYIVDGFDCHSYNRQSAAAIIADFKKARDKVSKVRDFVRSKVSSFSSYSPALISSEWSCKAASNPAQCLRDVYTVSGGLPSVIDASFPFIWRWCAVYGASSTETECRNGNRTNQYDIRDVPALRDAFREGVNDMNRALGTKNP